MGCLSSLRGACSSLSRWLFILYTHSISQWSHSSWIQISISLVPNYLVLVSWIAHFMYSPYPLCSFFWNTSTFRTLHLLFLLPRMSFFQTYLWQLSPSPHINIFSNIISSVKCFLMNLFKLTIALTLALTTYFHWFIFIHSFYPLVFNVFYYLFLISLFT